MNKIKYALICLAMIGLYSCDDYLEVTPPDQMTSASYWRDESDVVSALSSAYSQMYHAQYTTDQWTLSEVKFPVECYRGDDVIMGNDAMNYPNWVDLYKFSYTNGNSQFTYYWEDAYRGINFCNEILDKIGSVPEGKLSDTGRSTYIAEARFLRGYYSMLLLLNWERIVIRDTYITSGESSALDRDLATRPEAWDFIVDDLKAAEALPQSWDSNNTGRATRGAAYAFLGWAYLTRAYEETDRRQEFLQDAVEALNNVQGYELVKDFKSMFDGTNKNSSESIFEQQFSLNDANGALYRTEMHHWIGCAELGGWDEILPSQSLMDEYMKEGQTATTGRYDSRLYASVFFQCDYFNDGTGRVYGSNYDDWFGGKNRPAFRKLMPATKEALDLDATDVNIPLMRYANVLLMKAEALNLLGRTAEAIPLINEVRSVHGDMPPMTGTTADAVQAQIEHERMIEFPLENNRWYDLRRWGKAAQALQTAGRTGFDASKYSFYPTPQSELNANRGITR